MLKDTIPFEDAWKHRPYLSRSAQAMARFIKRRTGADIVYDTARIPFGRSDLLDLLEIAETLRAAGVITGYGPGNDFPDEPPFKQWRARLGTGRDHVAGGMAIDDDRGALLPTLAEAQERYVWFEADDYFISPRKATAAAIARAGAAILPDQFAGFSDAQRASNPNLALASEATYTWIQGASWTHKRPVWIPAQIVSGLHGGQVARGTIKEPLIISPITTGLATGPTRAFALLGGALEIIERDAFMITWMNKLSPERIAPARLAAVSPSLAHLLSMCDRYRLAVEFVRLPTDVPTYAMCAVVRDDSGGPQISIGLRAHQSIAKAAEGALLEALRIRHTIRYRQGRNENDARTDTRRINHLERAGYWAVDGRRDNMSFFTEGAVIPMPHEVWENDSLEEHLERIVAWTRTRGYEFASVDLGRSKKNVSPWHIHMLVMPQMQPIHQNERLAYLGGARLSEVPRQFGYEPLAEPYTDEPHPFA